MEIIKLYDCKTAAELIVSIGIEYKMKKKTDIWSDPILFETVTLLEVLIIAVLVGVVMIGMYLF